MVICIDIYKYCFHWNTVRHSNTGLVCNYLYLGIKSLTWYYNESCYLLGTITEVLIVVVVKTPTSDSHRWPVYIGGQSQYGIFPFIRHVPPDTQYPTGHITSKNKKRKHRFTFISIYCLKKQNIRSLVWQFLPLQPVAHLHIKSSSLTVQTPPFWHTVDGIVIHGWLAKETITNRISLDL
jgi:hypothetical protein